MTTDPLSLAVNHIAQLEADWEVQAKTEDEWVQPRPINMTEIEFEISPEKITAASRTSRYED